MLRRIIHIDEELCNGCGACAAACHEGAIRMVDGKPRLIREDYCDGLGDCLPACPAGAIRFEEREAPAYNASAAEADKEAPESGDRTFSHEAAEVLIPSWLKQWPVQLKLAPVNASFYNGADLLVAADCTAYAYGNFHDHFMRNRVTLIGCPKLDGVDYAEKLTQILTCNAVRSVTVVRMEVPCCGGLENAVRRAIHDSGNDLPLGVSVLSTDGRTLA